MLCLIVIAFFNGLSKVTISETVEDPSLFIFEELQASYSSTLSCPCQKISISYEKFLDVVPHYHTVSKFGIDKQNEVNLLNDGTRKENFVLDPTI